MDEAAMKHIKSLGRHGATVCTLAGTEPVSMGFYWRVLKFCEQYRINCIGYDMKIPDTDEPMTLAIWRNGHVDSGSAEMIQMCMEQG